MLDVKHISNDRECPEIAKNSYFFRFHSDITYSTMDQRKLDRLRRDVEAAWNSPQTAADLQSLAQRCGRRERTGGKHSSIWVTDVFPHRPFPIPTHGGRDVAVGVRKVVLAALEADLAGWEEILEATENNNGNGE
jgi:hypothetical protein